ncbi:MAG: hypothetical protein RMJ36_03960, partial [Candidatus Calescibacterium sp.]|nr:hypothetical protein [Candidatus Calescibacterium sp.]MDW8132792.1 hypothetical protein [Candidatus Calescibacterium sp.]
MESQLRIEDIQSNTEPQIHDPKPTIAFKANEGIIVVKILNRIEEFSAPFPTKESLKQQIRTEINQKKSSLAEDLFQEIKRIFESNNIRIEKIGINIRNEPNQEIENPNGSVWGNQKDENFRIESFNNIIEYDILLKELIDSRNQTLPINRKAKIIIEYEMYGSFRIGGGFTYRNENIVQKITPS